MVEKRYPMIVGNWKMYKTIEEALAFFDTLIPLTEHAACRVLVAVPFTAIFPAKDRVKKSAITIGAQNINDASEGAFTGEIAAKMVKEAGADFAIVGHSERRRYFHETDVLINKKIQRAIEVDLPVILCVGETFEERESGKTEDILRQQIMDSLHGISADKAHLLTLAYEPVWAIGTGKAATPEIAQSTHQLARSIVKELIGEAAGRMSILYGGSVNPENSKSFISEPDINGLLIGNASLKPESFAKIITSCKL